MAYGVNTNRSNLLSICGTPKEAGANYCMLTLRRRSVPFIAGHLRYIKSSVPAINRVVNHIVDRADYFVVASRTALLRRRTSV
jgi:hypothetical protein